MEFDYQWYKPSETLPATGEIVRAITTEGLECDVRRGWTKWIIPGRSPTRTVEVVFWRKK